MDTLPDTNIIWNLMRPVFTQVIASSIQDRLTRNALRNLCVTVLADDKVKSQFREVFADVWQGNGVQKSLMDCVANIASAPAVGQATAALFQNACVDGKAAGGVARVLKKALAMPSTRENATLTQWLEKSIAGLPQVARSCSDPEVMATAPTSTAPAHTDLSVRDSAEPAPAESIAAAAPTPTPAATPPPWMGRRSHAGDSRAGDSQTSHATNASRGDPPSG